MNPFLALRSYLPAGHPDKGKEIGSEATPAAFLSTLLALTREWRRLLTPTGSLCVELGDTYAGTVLGFQDHHATPAHRTPGRQRQAQDPRKDKTGKGWPLDKSLCLIPSSYAWALAYGHNPHNPDDRIEPWRVRNLIVWHRPNPPVGALGDKVRPATSYITVACTRRDRWFDLDAERTAYKYPDQVRAPLSNFKDNDNHDSNRRTLGEFRAADSAGAPPLDCWIDGDTWTIPTAPYKGAHYATFPPALPRRLINLMCPRQVCVVCGQPRRRITSEPEYIDRRGIASTPPTINRGEYVKGQRNVSWSSARTTDTLGWSDCECPCPVAGLADLADRPPWYPSRYRRGLVLDPFAGSGTTLQAASELGRDSIGIDLDPRNLELAIRRCGMFLTYDEAVS